MGAYEKLPLVKLVLFCLVAVAHWQEEHYSESCFSKIKCVSYVYVGYLDITITKEGVGF